jgi:DNA-binding MarR family transcriptional regulator
MNNTAKLVTAWVAFEEGHAEASIEDFCRYYLASNRGKEENVNNLFDGELPPRPDIVITKLLDRISRMHMVYIQLALQGMPIDHFEEFSLLSAIANLKTPRKTEVIYHTINELSTGLNLLAGMKKKGYITEHHDPDDKRSKRLKLTNKGRKILESCYERFSKIPEIIFMDMSEQDIRLCIQLLKNVNAKFSSLWLSHKNKSFDYVYDSMKVNRE